MKNVRILIDIDINDIAGSISELEYEDILEIIQHIDGYVADWDFTKSVFEYFQLQMDVMNSDDDNKAYAKGYS